MVTLLINDNSKSNILNESSFGGLPVTEIGKSIEWPTCKICGAEMQYLGKIKTDIGMELIYMCNDDPGVCEEWSAEDGGNKVIIVSGDQLEFVKPTERKLSLREVEHGVKLLEVDEADYDSARDNWTGGGREILGQLGGKPSWIQGEEIPNCDCCSKPMRFVAQLEQGPDYDTEMNFAGGVAYLFDCREGRTGKFLWQC